MQKHPNPTPEPEPTNGTTRFGLVLTSVLATAPFALMVLVHLTSLWAAWIIGRWQGGGVDDPRYIIEGDFLYTALGYLVWASIMTIYPSLVLTPIMLFWGRKRFTFPVRCTLTFLFAAGWIWLRWDPLQRMFWWID